MGQFYLSTSILNRANKRIVTIIGIYGPADHGRSGVFLEEISAKVARTNTPLLMGGDFNLIRAACDKNNDRLNWRLVDLFNDTQIYSKHMVAWRSAAAGAVAQPAAAQPASAQNYQDLARAILQVSVINAMATLIVLIIQTGVLLGSVTR
jgi:hypothetical protein